MGISVGIVPLVIKDIKYHIVSNCFIQNSILGSRLFLSVFKLFFKCWKGAKEYGRQG